MSLQMNPAPFLYGGWLLKPRFATPPADGFPFAITAPHSSTNPPSETSTALPFTSTAVVRAKPSPSSNTPGTSLGGDFFGTLRGASGLLNLNTAIGCGASSFFTPKGVKRAWTE